MFPSLQELVLSNLPANSEQAVLKLKEVMSDYKNSRELFSIRELDIHGRWCSNQVKDPKLHEEDRIIFLKEAYCAKVFAARRFEELGRTRDAAFSYDRAGGIAAQLGWVIPCVMAKLRGGRLFSQNKDEKNYLNSVASLHYAIHRLSEGSNAKRYMQFVKDNSGPNKLFTYQEGEIAKGRSIS